MGRFRNYGQARGTRSYLSRLEEYSLTPEEKHAAYLRRKAADEAAVKRFAIGAPKPVGPIWDGPVDYEAMLKASNAAAAAKAAPALAPVGDKAPVAPASAVLSPAPQTADLFACLEEDEAEEVGDSPAP